jgi:gliding motility-associated-like protein
MGVQLYRSISASGPFQPLSYFPIISGNANYSYIDYTANAGVEEYFYYATLIDSCQLPAVNSSICKSVLLKVTTNSDMTNTLDWTDYYQYSGNTQSFYIYRALDGIFGVSPIDTVLFPMLTYIDDVSNEVSHGGKFSYYIDANEGNGNAYGLQESSSSNIAEAYQGDAIYIPNAFTPRGKNKLFLPITQFVEKTEYKVHIYNRWGEEIWTTESDTEGWDGANEQQGLYAYRVEFKNSIGEYKEIKGTVFLIR